MQYMQDFDVLREIISVQVNKTKKIKSKKEKCIAGLGTIILERPLCGMCTLLTRHSVKKINLSQVKWESNFLIFKCHSFSKTASGAQITSDCLNIIQERHKGARF